VAVEEEKLTASCYSLVEVETASNDLAAAGVLLLDSTGRLHVRFRRDWEHIARADDVEVLELLEEEFERWGSGEDLGGAGLLEALEERASHLVRITDREAVEVANVERTLNRLYRRHVRSNVVEFRSHLPLYSLRAAAGKFLDNEEVRPEGWVEMPKGMRLNERQFLARIVGHSMEPRIPDGSLCVFRFFGGGSRKGLPVLVENRRITGEQRYTVKIYHSRTVAGEKGKAVFLEALNPEYESWSLDPDEDAFAIIAEFLQVVE